jgi:hypothetical protein
LRDFAFEDVKNPQIESATKWNQQFPFDVPNFPVSRPYDISVSSTDASVISGSSARDAAGFPSFLPPFPPAHTYKRNSSSSAGGGGGGGGSGAGTGTSSRKRQLAQQQVSVKNEPREDEATKKVQRIANIKSAQNSLAVIEDSVDSCP